MAAEELCRRHCGFCALELLALLEAEEWLALAPPGDSIVLELPRAGTPEGWIIQGRSRVILGRGDLSQRLDRLQKLVEAGLALSVGHAVIPTKEEHIRGRRVYLHPSYIIHLEKALQTKTVTPQQWGRSHFPPHGRGGYIISIVSPRQTPTAPAAACCATTVRCLRRLKTKGTGRFSWFPSFFFHRFFLAAAPLRAAAASYEAFPSDEVVLGQLV